MLYVMTIAIPWQVYMVPQYKMMTMFHLVDSHLGLILMHAFTATGVFLIRQFFMGIPTELLEAARIDGLSEYGIWAKIMLPLSKPAIATLCITSFTFEWNDFMGPLIYISTTSKKTIQLLLRMFNYPVLFKPCTDHGSRNSCPDSGTDPVCIPSAVFRRRHCIIWY